MFRAKRLLYGRYSSVFIFTHACLYTVAREKVVPPTDTDRCLDLAAASVVT